MFYSRRVIVQAPAKVNLALDITGVTGDGYHLLESAVQSVDLCDVLLIGRGGRAGLRVTCSSPDVPEDDMNIAHRAAAAFFATVGLPMQGLSIHIDKAIPIMAGLGGGSADAAGVLVGLNRLFETALSTEQLCEIGARVGCDVPFCIVGGTALVQGVGEQIQSLRPLENCCFAIAKPVQNVDTGLAFSIWDDSGIVPDIDKVRHAIRAIEAADLRALGNCLYNVFELLGQTPDTELLKGIMLCDGALGAVLSGSGSSVVGLFAAEKDARTSCRHLQEQERTAKAGVFYAKPVPHGARILHE